MSVLLVFLRSERNTNSKDLEKNYVSKLNDFTVVLSVDDAVTQYEGSGGNLTVWSDFGLDLLSSNANLLSERQLLFHTKYPNFSQIFHSLVNGDTVQFKNGLRYFIGVTENLQKYLYNCCIAIRLFIIHYNSL